MTSYKSIFGGNLERVKPMPKIMSVSLALFFAFFATHAVAGDDNDCVSIPEDAGFPYAGQTYCCNLLESRLPDGAHNAKYGDIIPWDKYKGTVKKCEGSFFEDDEWVRYIRLGSQQENFIEYETVTKNHLMYYSEYDESNKFWVKPKCNEEYKTLNIHCSIDTNTNGTYADFVHPQNGYNLRSAGSINYIYKCEESKLPHLKEYIATVMGKEVIESKKGDINYRSFDKGLLVGVDICINSQWQPYTLCTPFSESKFKEKFPADNHAVNNLGIYYIDATNNCISFPALEKLSPQEEEKTAEKSSSEEEPEESSSETESVIQYGYQQCSSNSDCTREKLSAYLNGNPYLHSTDWYCIEQTSGNHVCAAKACEDEYEIKTINGNPQGYCIKKTAPVAAAGQTPPAGQQQKQSDSNSDKSTVTSEQKQQSNDAERIKQLTTTVDSAYASLQTLTKNLSVWKNTEGNFNTARLVSDSAAGVVLGTVGGVVTATLVKKNQIKKGFESIQCTVGGQTIGGYGDQIKIGR